MALAAENISFSYQKGTPLLQNIAFSVGEGDLLAVLGPNGAGKTTLLRCLMGFLPLSTGRVVLDGKDIRTLSSRALWRFLAYVPQSRSSFDDIRACDMILLGCVNRLHAFASPAEKDRAEAAKIADSLGIAYLLDKPVSEMSGGEKQMVLIARALMAKPKILILDEPESGLDFRNQLIVLDTLSRLAAGGMCVIFNTHYPEHALMRSTKALLLDKNGGAVFGGTSSVVTEAHIERAFGVKTAIFDVETAGNVYQSILPLALSEDGADAPFDDDDACIAVVSAVFPDFAEAARINAVLHEYGRFIVGRMGMPYPDGGVFVVNVTLDAPQSTVKALVGTLGAIPHVNVKATVSPKHERGDARD